MSSVMLVSIRPLASWGRRRDCLLFWSAMAIMFNGLNAVDSRSGEFKMAQIQKIDRVCIPRAGTASDPIWVTASVIQRNTGHVQALLAAFRGKNASNSILQ